MKIIIAKNMVPFVEGGAETLARELVTALEEHGHTVGLVEIPFRWQKPHEILENVVANRLLHLDDAERLIALKFPTYVINHPNKIVWLLHQFRQAYDLWDTPYSTVPTNEYGQSVRSAIHAIDNRYLPTAKKIYTISKTVTKRLKENNEIDSRVLYPPLADTASYTCKPAEDYFYYPSRYTEAKRQLLVLEALQYTKQPVKIVFSGNVDDHKYLESLEYFCETHSLQDRVRFERSRVSEQDKKDLFAKSLGVVYVPFNEDYGYVTLEAMYSKKPIITVKDSGEPGQFITNTETGMITETKPEALAEALDLLWSDRQKAKAIGENAYTAITALGISWEKVVTHLLQ